MRITSCSICQRMTLLSSQPILKSPFQKKISTTHLTFIVNIYNMWWKGLELNFIVPTKIHNLPNWLMGPTPKRATPQISASCQCVWQSESQNLKVIRASFGRLKTVPNVKWTPRTVSPKSIIPSHLYIRI